MEEKFEEKFEEKRKKGGQPGNHNALKHGFYAKALTHDEQVDLAKVGIGLVDEISLIRSIIRRVAELGVDEQSRHELMGLLDTLGAAGVRLASMLRTQRVYFEGATAEVVQQALEEALADFWARQENGPGLG
jgi:hypothetical protein